MNSSNREKILELERRRKIYELIKKHAGCHFRDLQRKSNFPATSLRYHLNFLSKNQLVHEEKRGNNIHYFPQEIHTGNKILLSLLRKDTIRKIILYLLNNESSTHRDLTHFLRLAPSTVSWHMKILLKQRIVEITQKNEKRIYKLLVDKKVIMHLLITYQESFLDSLVNKAISMWEIE